METIETKEVAVVKGQVTKGFNAASALVITTDENMLEAGELRKKIKTVAKMIDNEKMGMTKPINDGLKKIRDFFRPLEDRVAEAETIITNKMLAYNREQEAKRKIAEKEANDKILEAQKKAEEGKITEKQADKIAAKEEKKLDAAPVAIKKTDTFHTRKVKKFRIVNRAAIPADYLVVDEVAVRKAMMNGIAVEGVEYYEEDTLV